MKSFAALAKKTGPVMKSQFGPYLKVIASATAAAGSILALGGGVLRDLAPPTVDADYVVRFTTIVVAALLMIFSATLSSKLTGKGGEKLVVGCAVLLISMVTIFLAYRYAESEYVYMYPAGLEPSKQTKHVRGIYHTAGVRLAEGHSTEATVARAGGTEAVEHTDILWPTGSLKRVGHGLVVGYILLVTAATATLYLCAYAVLSLKKPK